MINKHIFTLDIWQDITQRTISFLKNWNISTFKICWNTIWWKCWYFEYWERWWSVWEVTGDWSVPLAWRVTSERSPKSARRSWGSPTVASPRLAARLLIISTYCRLTPTVYNHIPTARDPNQLASFSPIVPPNKVGKIGI